MTDLINPSTAEVTQATHRALGDKPSDVCINPPDERVDIDMAKLATDTTPYTDIEAEMARAKLRKPEYPVNYAQHCEAKALASEYAETDCPTCAGHGWVIYGIDCDACDGLGVIEHTTPETRQVLQDAWNMAQEAMEQKRREAYQSGDTKKLNKYRQICDAFEDKAHDVVGICSECKKPILTGQKFHIDFDNSDIWTHATCYTKATPTTAILQEPATCAVCHGTIERGKKASIVPGGFIHYRSEPCQRTLEREHVERSRNTPTTAEFMDILNEITFQQFMHSLQPKYALLAPPTVKSVETPAQPAKVQWTVASAKQWLEQREEITRTAFENAKIDKKRATADDIRNVCHAITALGGPRYPYLMDELNCVRILERNTDEKLVDMLKTLNRKLWNMYASHAKAALGDDGKERRL